MDIYSKLQAVATLILAVGAIVVTFWTPNSFRWKLLVVFLFVVAAIVTVWLQEQKEDREKSRVESAQAELLKLQQEIINLSTGGESFCYMRLVIGIHPSGMTPMFIVQGQHPLYNVNVEIVDLQKFDTIVQSEHIRPEDNMPAYLAKAAESHISLGDLGSTQAIESERPITFSSSERQDFRLVFSARNGSWDEDIQLRKVGSNGWSQAIRVFRLIDNKKTLIFQEIGKNFPVSEPDWHR